MLKKFGKYGCPLYEKLCVIYGDITATGSNTRPSAHSSTDNEEYVRDPPTQEEDKSQPLSDEDDNFGNIPNTSQGYVRPTQTPFTRHKGKKAKTSDALMTILNSYNENIKRKVEVWEKFLESSSISTAFNQDVTSKVAFESKSSRTNILKESLEALDALDGTNGVAYPKAIEKFQDDELRRESFLQLPNNRKKDWVLNLK